MDVKLPDGTVLQGVPEGTTQQDIIAKVRRWNPEMGKQMLNATVETMAGDAPVDGPFDAAMISAGRAATRLGRGAAGLLLKAAGAPGAAEGLERRDARESGLMGPVSEQHPVASAIGESLPYFAAPMGAAGAVGGKMLGAAPKLAQAVRASPVADAALTGGVMGGLDTEGTALGGAAGGLLGGAAGSIAGRAIRPIASTASEGVSAAVDKMRGLGLTPTPAQVTGSRGLGLAEASLRSSPFSAGAFEKIAGGNQSRANQIAAEAIGESGEAVTSTVLDRAARRIGDTFESVADAPAIGLADDFIDALARVESGYGEAVTEPHVRAAVTKAIDGAIEAAVDGGVTGRAALNAASQAGKNARSLFKGAKSDPEAAKAFQGIKDAWDDAIMGSVDETKAAALGEARKQWRNLLMLERPGVIKSPELGDVSIASLGNALRQQDKAGFMRGRRSDPLSELGQVGKAMPAAVGDSGTASRLALPAAGMAGAMLSADDFASGQFGQGAAQMALPALLMAAGGRGYTSPMARKYLERGLLPLTEGGRKILSGAGARLGGGGLLAAQNNR